MSRFPPGRALATAALLFGAGAGACNDPAGLADSALAGTWTGAAGVHEFTLDLRRDSVRVDPLFSHGEFGLPQKPSWQPASRVRGRYRDGATGQTFTLPQTHLVGPGAGGQMNGTLWARTPTEHYVFTGQLADPRTVGGTLSIVRLTTDPQLADLPPTREVLASFPITFRRQ